MVRKGTQLTFAVSGDVSAWFTATPQDVRSGADAVLQSYFDVRSLTLTPIGTVITGTLDWSYTATVTVAPFSDYNSADDVKSVVVNAFWEAAGAAPTVALVRSSDASLAVQPAPAPGIGGDGQGVPWSTALVFVSLAIGLVAIFGLKKL